MPVHEHFSSSQTIFFLVCRLAWIKKRMCLHSYPYKEIYVYVSDENTSTYIYIYMENFIFFFFFLYMHVYVCVYLFYSMNAYTTLLVHHFFFVNQPFQEQFLKLPKNISSLQKRFIKWSAKIETSRTQSKSLIMQNKYCYLFYQFCLQFTIQEWLARHAGEVRTNC